MKKKELYRLPSFGRMEFRAIFVRAAGFYLLALSLLAWILAQRLAHRLAYPQALGEPWVTAPDHLRSVFLILSLLAGAAALVFLVQRADCEGVAPADDIDPAYGRELRRAAAAGVEVFALGARVTTHSIAVEGELPVWL